MGSKAKSVSGNARDAPLALHFNDVSSGLSGAQLRFRLIHFWEAKNISKGGVFLGLELLMIDQQGTVMQGFVSASRADTYRRHLKGGAIYTLQNFFAVPNKDIYRVADMGLTVTFTNGSVLSLLDVEDGSFPGDRFRFHSHAEFQANCGRRSDLYDIVGHLRLVDGQSLIERPVLDLAEIEKAGFIVVHIQVKDGPVMKMSLWDGVAREFCIKFASSVDTPTVLLVTTVNPKDMSGSMTLNSMASSRVFLDQEVQPTVDYVNWLGLNPDIAKHVNADEVTKVELMTISQILTYIKQDDAKVASFYCIATVDDVYCDRPWYYIGCSKCHTKVTKGHSTLMCAKCGKYSVTGVPIYLARISVYDNMDKVDFVLLGDAGNELVGKPAAQLVDEYYEITERSGADHQVPVPQDMLAIIGQTHKFKVKVSDLNLSGKVQAITVIKVVAPDVLPPLGAPDEVSSDEVEELKGGDEDGVVGTSDGAPAAKRPKLDA